MSLYSKNSKYKCPHCGNENKWYMEDNGLPSTDSDFTLLCINPIPIDETCDPEWYRANPDEEVVCGMQWEPNNPD